MAKTIKTIPEKVVIAGVPFSISLEKDEILTAGNLITDTELAEQRIAVKSDFPFPRQLSYVIGAIGRQLLDAAGVKTNQLNKIWPVFGTVLYRLIRENNFTWILDNKETEGPPSTIFVNGMPYTVTLSEDAHLDDLSLLGEVAYTQLSIKLHSKLKPEVKAVVFLHEVVHAMLYEARLTNICNNESLVEPLSYFLYQLFKQNDFSFAYNG